MIELRGNIEQFYRKDRRLFFCGDTKIAGSFGASVWWIPIGDNLGLKIYNKQGFEFFNNAQDRKKALSRKWEKFLTGVHYCREHIPLVYDWVVVKFNGKYTRGGKNRNVSGEAIDVYYPACIQKKYDVPRCFPDDAKKTIGSVFELDGFLLHHDTLSLRQIGINNGKYVVLDIHLVDGGKFI